MLDKLIAGCQAAQTHLDHEASIAEAFLQQPRIETAAAATAATGSAAADTAARIESSVLRHNIGKDSDPKKTARVGPYQKI